MTTLTDFLMQRIAEDERHARKLAETDRRPVLSLATTVNHPERILLECEAKRRIVEMHSDVHECVGWKYGQWDTVYVHPDFAFHHDPTLRLLALPYADHPEYDERWRP